MQFDVVMNGAVLPIVSRRDRRTLIIKDEVNVPGKLFRDSLALRLGIPGLILCR